MQRVQTKNPKYISRWAEINAPQTRSEERGKRKEERGKRKEENSLFSILSSLFSLLLIGGNPQPIGGERKVQLIMFTYLNIAVIVRITEVFWIPAYSLWLMLRKDAGMTVFLPIWSAFISAHLLI